MDLQLVAARDEDMEEKTMKKILRVMLLLWVLRWFNTADELVHFLNTLPSDVAMSAKILTAPSQRNVLGWVGQPYGLIYWQ